MCITTHIRNVNATMCATRRNRNHVIRLLIRRDFAKNANLNLNSHRVEREGGTGGCQLWSPYPKPKTLPSGLVEIFEFYR